MRLRPSPEGPHSLGYHAKGPFLVPAKKGAHEEYFLLEATEGMKSWEDVYDAEALDQDGVKFTTAAPDVGVYDCVAPAVARGVTFSSGHSNAPVDLAAEAVSRGAR